MSDGFQFLAATDVSETDAPAKGAELVQWLIREKIVRPEPNHDSAHSQEPGYPPGPRSGEACDAAGSNAYLDTIPNTMTVETSRKIYYSCPGDLDVRCAICGAQFSDQETWQRYADAIGELFDHGTIGMLKCIRCETERSILEWQREGPLVVANLGLEIWNWPPLSKRFLAKVEDITGSSIRYLAGSF